MIFNRNKYTTLHSGWSEQQGAMICRDDRVYDMTESLMHTGVRLGMKRLTAERLAPLAMVADRESFALPDFFHLQNTSKIDVL